MLCCSCNKTTMAKEGEKKKGEPRVWSKNMVQLFCLWPLMTYRLAAAHTPPPELLFPRHSSASWWSHRGGIWPGWCHSLLWCSHPHPTDHFCKTKSHLVELSSPWASLIVFPTLLSWINMQAQKADTAGSLPPRMRLVPKGRSAAEGGWDAQGSLSLTLTICFPSPLLHLLLSLIFFPKPLPLLFLKSIKKWNKEKTTCSCSAPKQLVLLGQIICILDTLEVFHSYSLSMLLLAFWTFHHFRYLH